MFDIGIMELALIGVVALLVIGPERLPAVARTVGFWFGKVRRFVSSVQEDFNREVVKSEELKRLVEEQAKIKDVHEIIEKTVDDSKKTVSVGADLNSASETEQQKESSQESIPETPQLGSNKPVDSNKPAESDSELDSGKMENAGDENEHRQDASQPTEHNKT